VVLAHEGLEKGGYTTVKQQNHKFINRIDNCALVVSFFITATKPDIFLFQPHPLDRQFFCPTAIAIVTANAPQLALVEYIHKNDGSAAAAVCEAQDACLSWSRPGRQDNSESSILSAVNTRSKQMINLR
jgi:hypothetical protein